MRRDSDLDYIRKIKLTGFIGKTLTATIVTEDSARDPKDFTGMTAWGTIYDETGASILDLAPTTGGTAGTYIIDVAIPSNITAGWYTWKGGTLNGLVEEPLFEGPVHLRTY